MQSTSGKASKTFQDKKTGCVYKYGSAGRKLDKKRAKVTKSHKRAGRPSPNIE